MLSRNTKIYAVTSILSVAVLTFSAANQRAQNVGSKYIAYLAPSQLRLAATPR